MLLKTIVLLGCVVFLSVAEVIPTEECPCPVIPEGSWSIALSEPIAFGYKATGTFTTIHLYDEIYYGAVRFPGWIPLTRTNLRHMGYLNRTSCAFKGSMADVPSRRTVTYNLIYVHQEKTNVLSGQYHRMTNTYIDDRIGLMNITYTHPPSAEEIAELKAMAAASTIEM